MLGGMTTVNVEDKQQQQGQILKSMSAVDRPAQTAEYPPGDPYLGSDVSEAGSECPELEMEMESSENGSTASQSSSSSSSVPDDITARNAAALEAAKALLSQFIVEQEYYGHDHTATPALTPNGSSWIMNGFAFSRLGLQPGKLLLNPAPLDTPSNTPIVSMLKPEVRKSSSLFLRLQ